MAIPVAVIRGEQAGHRAKHGGIAAAPVAADRKFK
jgi:hypothetical protein